MTAQMLHISFDPTPINKKNKKIFDLLGLGRLSPYISEDINKNVFVESSNTYYITLVDEESLHNGKADWLISTYRKWNVAPTILTNYDSSIGNWSKIIALRDHLENSSHIGDNDLIVFTDANDVLVASPSPPDFSNILSEYNVDILYGAENRFAKANRALKHVFDTAYADHENRYLNAGFLLGRKKQVLAFYRYLCKILHNLSYVNINRSEQAVVIYGFVRTSEKHNKTIRLGVDYNSKCVSTVNSVTPVPVEIVSPFVHVTSQRDRRQAEKWSRLLELII